MDCLLFLNSQAMKEGKEKWKSRMNGKRSGKTICWTVWYVIFRLLFPRIGKNLFYWLVFFLQLKDVRVVKLGRNNRAKSEENALRHLPRCFESSTLKLICANSGREAWRRRRGEIGRNLLPFDYFESLLRSPNCQRISASIPLTQPVHLIKWETTLVFVAKLFFLILFHTTIHKTAAGVAERKIW